MTSPIFFRKFSSVTVNEIASWCDAKVIRGDGSKLISGVSPIEDAQDCDIVFLDNRKYIQHLSETQAAACLIEHKHVENVPEKVIPLIVENPYRAYATILTKLYPEGLRPLHVCQDTGISPFARVSESAFLEGEVCVDAGACIGQNVEIGNDTYIGPNAVIGSNCRIGRNCSIGSNSVCQHAIIGDEVILHPGVCIGQDGFGYSMGMNGHQKVPQIGRVIIQNQVEIGANTTIDRGANRDTIIGEGTKIDNLVQIGHNSIIGRHCVLVSQVAIAGSVTIGDFVVIGGQTVVDGHSTVGDNTQIAAVSSVYGGLPSNGKFGGVPAKPIKQWLREVTAVSKLAGTNRSKMPDN